MAQWKTNVTTDIDRLVELQSMCNDWIHFFRCQPSCHPPSPGGDSKLGKCLSPCLSCPSWPYTGSSHLWGPDAKQTSQGPPQTSEMLTEMRMSENDFTPDNSYVLSVTNQNVFAFWQHTHSFIRFTAWRWTFPVVGVEWSQTRSFLFFVCLSTLFLLFLDFLVFALVTYLASGCRDDTCNVILNYMVSVDHNMRWAWLSLTCVKLFSPLGRLRDRPVGLIFLFMVTFITFILLWTFHLHHWLLLLGWNLQ